MSIGVNLGAITSTRRGNREIVVKKVSAPPSPEDRRRPPGRPKVMSDAVQRDRIVEGARKLLLEKGYGRTTTDDVAAGCRISKQTLYRHFPGKLALFAAIVDSHRQSMLALPGNYGNLPLDRALEKIFRIDIDPQADRERVALLRLVVVESQQYPELANMLRQHGADRSRADLSKWLAAQSRQGLMSIDDADSTARILMDMIFGVAALKDGRRIVWPSAKKRQDHIRRCVSIFLAGVVPRFL
jgi:TetR/AcrR family transcriptional repressor of mexJK operon